MIKCHYCDTFKRIPKSLRKMSGERDHKISLRYCRAVGKEVTSSTNACQHFSLTELLWCERHNQWIHIIACIHLHKTKAPQHQRCSQCKDEVMDAARGKDLYAEFGLVRKNHTNNYLHPKRASERRPTL